MFITNKHPFNLLFIFKDFFVKRKINTLYLAYQLKTFKISSLTLYYTKDIYEMPVIDFSFPQTNVYLQINSPIRGYGENSNQAPY